MLGKTEQDAAYMEFPTAACIECHLRDHQRDCLQIEGSSLLIHLVQCVQGVVPAATTQGDAMQPGTRAAPCLVHSLMGGMEQDD